MAIQTTIIETRGRKKQELVIKKLIRVTREHFEKISIPIKSIPELEVEPIKRGKPAKIQLSDCLMSCFAMFSLKYASLLQFDQHMRGQTEERPMSLSTPKEGEMISHNLMYLYNIKNVPSDTYMRTCLDEVEYKDLSPIFRQIFSSLQRDKVLEDYIYLDEGYILSVDGTGYFSSHQIHCKNCCEKHHSNGQVTYFHQMLAGSIVHPGRKEVIPVCPEPIHCVDGQTKNDCERVAAKRFLERFRQDHPLLSVVVVEDSLSANGPHIRLLQKLKMHYIIVVKPDGNSSLFEWLKGVQFKEIIIKETSTTHKFKFYNKVPLNDANYDIEVNFLEYWEMKNGKTSHWTWVTDIEITEKNVYKLMRAGRSRWKIENETFNTLKNQGYNFEHNFGHGYKNLSDVMAMLMMLAFLVDQAQMICCRLFQAIKKKLISWRSFWERLRSSFFEFYILSWEDLYEALAYGHKSVVLIPNTS